MFKWIKNLLKRKPPSMVVEVATKNGFVRHQVVGTNNLALLVTGPDNQVRLVLPYQVRDQQHFWRIWKHLTGIEELKWEDGTSYRPWDQV